MPMEGGMATPKTLSEKPKRGYWYMHYCEECVLCGRTEEYKFRVYDKPKPEKVEDRYEFSQTACGIHFV